MNKRLLVAAMAATALAAWWAMSNDERAVPHLMAPSGPPVRVGASSSVSNAVPAVTQTTGTATQAAAEPKFRLLQVGIGDRSARELAVMRIDGGAPVPFGVGDSLAKGVRIVRIMASSIEVDDHGRLRRIALEPDADIALAALKPLREMRHGADAAAVSQPVAEPALIARAPDAPPPNSDAIGRAIDRVIERTRQR